MPKINSLYELIKEQKEKKGRPLKIVCDLDECIQPCQTKVLYDIIKEKRWYEGELPPFEEWFRSTEKKLG